MQRLVKKYSSSGLDQVFQTSMNETETQIRTEILSDTKMNAFILNGFFSFADSRKENFVCSYFTLGELQ